MFAGRDADTGRKQYISRTVRGGRRQAEKELARLVAQVDDGLITASPGTVGELVQRWYAKGELVVYHHHRRRVDHHHGREEGGLGRHPGRVAATLNAALIFVTKLISWATEDAAVTEAAGRTEEVDMNGTEATTDALDLGAGLDEPSSHPPDDRLKECDLVMKGGITGGVASAPRRCASSPPPAPFGTVPAG